MKTATFVHRVVDHQGRICFEGRLYQVPANLKCGRGPMVAATAPGVMLQTGPNTTIELTPIECNRAALPLSVAVGIAINAGLINPAIVQYLPDVAINDVALSQPVTQH